MLKAIVLRFTFSQECGINRKTVPAFLSEGKQTDKRKRIITEDFMQEGRNQPAMQNRTGL
jgi:hypothetical protein